MKRKAEFEELTHSRLILQVAASRGDGGRLEFLEGDRQQGHNARRSRWKSKSWVRDAASAAARSE